MTNARARLVSLGAISLSALTAASCDEGSSTPEEWVVVDYVGAQYDAFLKRDARPLDATIITQDISLSAVGLEPKYSALDLYSPRWTIVALCADAEVVAQASSLE